MPRRRVRDDVWQEADAGAVVNDAYTERILVQKGVTQELTPIDVATEPELRKLLDAISLDELI